MKNFNKLRSSGFWLFSLIAILLAYAQPARAYQDPRLVGENFGGWDFKDNASARVFGCSGAGTITQEISDWPGGIFKISAPYDDWTGQHQYSTSSPTTFTNGQSVVLSEQSYGNDMQLPSDVNGKTVTFKLTVNSNKQPTNLEVSWTTSSSTNPTLYLRGEMTDDWSALDAWCFSEDNGTYTLEIPSSISANSEWKIGDDNWGNGWASASNITADGFTGTFSDSGGNVKCNNEIPAGSVFTYNKSAGTLTIKAPTAQKTYALYYQISDTGNWAGNRPLTVTPGTPYEFTFNNTKAGYGMLILVDGKDYYGGKEDDPHYDSDGKYVGLGAGDFDLIKDGKKDFKFNKAGTYTITLYTNANGTPTKITVVEPKEHAYRLWYKVEEIKTDGEGNIVYDGDGNPVYVENEKTVDLKAGQNVEVNNIAGTKFKVQYKALNASEWTDYVAKDTKDIEAGVERTYDLKAGTSTDNYFEVPLAYGTYTFKLNVSSNSPTSITVSAPNMTEPESGIYVLGTFTRSSSDLANVSDWNGGEFPTIDKDGNTSQFSFIAKGGSVKFRIMDKKSGNSEVVYGANGKVTVNTDGTVYDVKAIATPGTSEPEADYFTFPTTANTTYTITYWKEYSGKPAVSVTASEKEKKYWLAAGFLGNWDKEQRIEFTPVPGKTNVLQVTTTYSEGNAGNKGFKIVYTDDKKSDVGTWYSLGESLVRNRDYTITGITKTANMKLSESPVSPFNAPVTFTLTLDELGKAKTLRASWKAESWNAINFEMPVYPIGVGTDEELVRYDQWPVLYLQATILNNEQVTPEYQMNRVDNDTYELELIMRETKTQGSDKSVAEHNLYIKGWGPDYDPDGEVVTDKENGYKFTFTGKDGDFNHIKKTISSSTANSDAANFRQGARVKFTAKRTANNKWKLECAAVGDPNTLPYVSMVGEDWSQSIVRDTPAAGKNTSYGWQEAWIQYDENGNVALDKEGNVMYNTMWPPRNPIKFNSKFRVNNEDHEIELYSQNLQFNVVTDANGDPVKKTGDEWRADDRFKDYATKLNALSNTKQYTLYRVPDMWIVGKCKLWTGWGGVTFNDNDKMANWTWHSNWGLSNMSHDATQISAETAYGLGTEYGDMYFDKPTYFQYVDLFYCDEDPGYFFDNDHKHAGSNVIFTELATGGAQIQAAASMTNKRGNYQASLNSLSNIAETATVKKVEIKSYLRLGDKLDETTDKVFLWEAKGEVKPKSVTEFHTLFDGETTRVNSTGAGKYESYASVSKWVEDKHSYEHEVGNKKYTGYVNGTYIYRMYVTIENQGTEEVVVVNSNPFTIFNDTQKIKLDVYQLVKTGFEPAKNGKPSVGTYVTFKGSEDDPTVPVGPVYKVVIYNDTKFDKGSDNVAFDSNGEVIGYIDDTDYQYEITPLDFIPNYALYKNPDGDDSDDSKDFETTYFTDKVFIRSSVITATEVEGFNFSAANANAPKRVNGPTKAPNTETWDLSRYQADDKQFMYVTNVGTFDERKFDLEMKYTLSYYDADAQEVKTVSGQANAPAVTYQNLIPEPTLKSAEIEVYYGKYNDGTFDPSTGGYSSGINLGDHDDNDTAPFIYKGMNFEARYTKVRDNIEVEFPNVSEFLKERMLYKSKEEKPVFQLHLDYDDSKNDTNVSWDEMYDFGYSASSEDKDLNLAVYTQPLDPGRFQVDRTLRLVKNDNYKYYSRGWKDLTIPAVELTNEAPAELDPTYEVSSGLEMITPAEFRDLFNQGYDEALHGNMGFLYEEVKITNIKHAGDPSNFDSDHSSPVPTGIHNAVKHQVLNGAEGETHNHYLRHHTDKDFYHVMVLELPAGASLDDYTDDKLEQYILKDTIVSADKVINGYDPKITIRKVHKENNKNSVFNYGTIVGQNEFWNALNSLNQNHFAKNLRVVISYLYPFGIADSDKDDAGTDTPQNSPKRVIESNVTNRVYETSATPWTPTFNLSDISTKVESIYDEDSNFGGVIVGEGYIEVEGNGVMVVNTAGVVIGQGAGHYDVEPGVYVVRYNGKSRKVVVR